MANYFNIIPPKLYACVHVSSVKILSFSYDFLVPIFQFSISPMAFLKSKLALARLNCSFKHLKLFTKSFSDISWMKKRHFLVFFLLVWVSYLAKLLSFYLSNFLNIFFISIPKREHNKWTIKAFLIYYNRRKEVAKYGWNLSQCNIYRIYVTCCSGLWSS